MKISEALNRYPQVTAKLLAKIRDIVAEAEGNPDAAEKGHERIALINNQLFSLSANHETVSVFMDMYGDLNPFSLSTAQNWHIKECGDDATLVQVQQFCVMIEAHTTLENVKGKQ